MKRLSTPRDLPSILSVAEQSGLFPPEHLDQLHSMLESYFSSEPNSDQIWITDIDSNSEVTSILFCEREAMTNETWNIRLIAVSPKKQRQGLGSSMLSYIENLLLERGGRLLIVDTSDTEDFESVRTFYKNCGYTAAATIPHFFDEGDGKITFYKALN